MHVCPNAAFNWVDIVAWLRCRAELLHVFEASFRECCAYGRNTGTLGGAHKSGE